ncbi:aldehyde dehydrogenase family protein [Candidimonas nitroreducens]|uniref:2-hydroxymuconic semialdehyde dehydrogenase n=1 Tax=Candidimonas nitroreducens TaxID=683354 RepID=A0A225MRL0_9BURK|nr:aldehyde dehydrogenase family protein [Candidimonas nitroreducens]OWT64007.1 2-hydroxymuconic semialdehyde dehydrogenase [Candidimonas nitroreducens]
MVDKPSLSQSSGYVGHNTAVASALDASRLDVISPYDGTIVTCVHEASVKEVQEAVARACAAQPAMAELPGFERARRLRAAAESLRRDSAELAALLSRETGKAIRESRVEMARAADVISLSAEEATRIAGRQIPLDASPVGAGKLAVSQRFPIGTVGMVVPFNAPVNLSCHKLSPALAAGNTCVLKAPPEAAGTVDRLVGHFLQAGFPDGAINLLQGRAQTGQALFADERLGFLSFTGSLRAGKAVKEAAGMRPCTLELGGLGPTVVHSDANLELAASACATSGFRLAGQSCASVQNIFVHTDVATAFKKMLVARVEALKVGDPLDPQTDLGPVINLAAAQRIVERIEAAVRAGARCLTGGHRDGTMVEPTVLVKASLDSQVVCEEIFGPVVIVHEYCNIQQTFDWVNATGYGINFGLFTESVSIALQAHRSVIAGAIIVNGTSTFRPDQIPYGGDRLSGYGRESPADSVRAMTRERLIVFQ